MTHVCVRAVELKGYGIVISMRMSKCCHNKLYPDEVVQGKEEELGEGWFSEKGGSWRDRDSDRSGRTMMDSVLAGSDVALATGFLAARATGVITRTHTFSLPICHRHSLALTQHYPSHHSSCVILLRDTN